MTPALIAITGADGFIGRATTAALGAAGFDLRLNGGPPAAARMSPRGQSLHDAFDLSADDAATRLGALLLGCDVVVHLAGPPHIVGPSASARRAVTQMRSPSRASKGASASPSPDDAPVKKTTRPLCAPDWEFAILHPLGPREAQRVERASHVLWNRRGHAQRPPCHGVGEREGRRVQRQPV